MSASKQDLNVNKTESVKASTSSAAEADADAPIRVNGFEQVLQLLQSADREFRESLLRRLGARDPNLVATLRKELRNLGY